MVVLMTNVSASLRHCAPRSPFPVPRLSMIDVLAGHQLFAKEDGTVVAPFKGEIYNGQVQTLV